MTSIFLDRDDERFKSSGKYFLQEGNQNGKILGEFFSYLQAVSFAQGLGSAVEDKISHRTILPEN